MLFRLGREEGIGVGISHMTSKRLLVDYFIFLSRSWGKVMLFYYVCLFPRSINIGIDGDFAPLVGAMIVDVKQPLVLITEPGREEEVITRLSRVGFDNVLGHLDGGFETWKASGKEVDHVECISAESLAGHFPLKEGIIIDIRKEGEYAAEHVEEAYSRPLAYINDWIADLPRDQHVYLYCASGYRSMIAASILQEKGYRNITNVDGGFEAISQTSIPKTDFVCRSRRSK